MGQGDKQEQKGIKKEGQGEKKEQKEQKKEVSPQKGFILIILFSIIVVCLFLAVRTKQNYDLFYKWVVEKNLFQCASVMIICLMIAKMSLSQFDNKGNLIKDSSLFKFDNKGNIKKDSDSQHKEHSNQKPKKRWEIIKIIWSNMNIDFECVHAAVYGVLFYLSIYQQKIPDFLSHDQTLVTKFNVQLRSVSLRAFSFLWIARVLCQFFNAINYIAEIQYRKAIKMAFGLSILIIEVCMVEILFTREETFHSLFVPHLNSTEIP